MKFTYANVMSTIAMIAALTTGTSYAATKLGPNSVRSYNIKNGQVTMADLHPSVRAKLDRTTYGGGSTTTTGTSWTDAKMFASTDAMFNCSNADCPALNSSKDGYIGRVNLGSNATYEFRLTGSVRNGGNIPMSANVIVNTASTAAALDALPMTKVIHCSSDQYGNGLSVAPGATVTLTCPVGAATGQYVKARFFAVSKASPDPASSSGNFTGSLKLEVRRSS